MEIFNGKNPLESAECFEMDLDCKEHLCQIK